MDGKNITEIRNFMNRIFETAGILIDENIDLIFEYIDNIIRKNSNKNKIILSSNKIPHSISWAKNYNIIIKQSDNSEAYISPIGNDYELESDDEIKDLKQISNFNINIFYNINEIEYLKIDLHHEFLHLYEIYNKKLKNINTSFSVEIYDHIYELKNDSNYYIKLLGNILYFLVPEETRAFINEYYNELYIDNKFSEFIKYIKYIENFCNISLISNKSKSELFDNFYDITLYMFKIKSTNIDIWFNKLQRVLKNKLNVIKYKQRKVYEYYLMKNKSNKRRLYEHYRYYQNKLEKEYSESIDKLNRRHIKHYEYIIGRTRGLT